MPLDAHSLEDPFEPWTNADSAWLDKTSLARWLASLRCPTEDSKKGLDAVAQQLVADNGRSAEQQSLLGVLVMIKGHGVDRYWTDTEVYRCIGGNAQLAQRFREELGDGVVDTGMTFVTLAPSQDHFSRLARLCVRVPRRQRRFLGR